MEILGMLYLVGLFLYGLGVVLLQTFNWSSKVLFGLQLLLVVMFIIASVFAPQVQFSAPEPSILWTLASLVLLPLIFLVSLWSPIEIFRILFIKDRKF